MDYLKTYGIRPYINAHDTITLYGASRMAENTKVAMNQKMRELGIYIGTEERYPAIYFSPLNLTDEECGIVIQCLSEIGGILGGS